MRPLIAGNWKMNGLAGQLGEIEAIAASVKALPPSADIVICLPATLIARAAQIAAGRIAICGEDCSAEVAGAFTGDLSAEMLRDAGAGAVICRAFGTPSTSWRDRRHGGGESESRMARRTSGDHLHRRDDSVAVGRQGVVHLRRSTCRQHARRRELVRHRDQL